MAFDKAVYLGVLIVLAAAPEAASQSRLTIGTDEWPPYEYREGGAVTGYCTEVIGQVLKRMGVETGNITVYPWPRAERFVFEGTIDALYSASKGAEREKYCYFPGEPLIYSSWVLFIRKEDENRITFNTLNDLKDKRIGLVTSYSYTPEFWDFVNREKNHEETHSDQLNFKKLVAKRIDCLVSEHAVGVAIAMEQGAGEKVVALTQHPVKTTGLYIMFSKKTVPEEFVLRFSEHLKRFKRSSLHERIRRKYFR